MLIAQDVNLLRPEGASDRVRSHLEIMIPQDGKHAPPCLEPPQRSSHGPDEGGRKSDVISRQRHQVGRTIVHQLDHALHFPQVDEQAVMDVAQLNNAQAVVGSRKTRQTDVGVGNLRPQPLRAEEGMRLPPDG